MKTIGLIGGMSWESSAEYYRIINTLVKEKLGGLHSARIVMVSVDFAEIAAMQAEGNWEEAGRALALKAHELEAAGADCVLLCTNTMHCVADEITRGLRVPFLHIADATGSKVRAVGLTKVGLLATRFTMEGEFYRDRLATRFQLEITTPSGKDASDVHEIIYSELCRGVILESSRKRYVEIIETLINDGAQGVILGCTEIGLLVRPQDASVPLFDTARLHAEAAVCFALE